MKCIVSPFTSCFKNIGSEEYFLSNFEEDIFYLYINSPCIVVGKHQNTSSEINQSYVTENQIDVVRRLSGGGAVYHDHGNLNFGFISKNKGHDIDAVFREFTLPILNVLKKLGVQAEFSGRNDLVIQGMKISGVAQYHTSNKVLLHGTLLFDSDLTKVSASLNADPRKFQDKSVKSIRSRVSNISPFLDQSLTIEEFTSFIINEVLLEFPSSSLYELSDLDVEEIGKLAARKYSTWEWVYGNSPKFTYQGEIKYEKGILEIGLNVESGLIRQVSIFGDFFGKKEVDELKNALKNVNYQRQAVVSALLEINLDNYIFGLTKDVFIESLFSNSL